MRVEAPVGVKWRDSQAALRRAAESSAQILVAVSGGSDSTGLLLLATTAVSAARILVGFVDHGLRAGVDSEWKQVSDLADSLGVEAVRLNLSAPPGIGNIQEWARDARYGVLSVLASERGIRTLVTGHTFDDQAETVMLRLLRGVGLDGLQGIPYERSIRDQLDVIRPFLFIRRSEIQRWLTSMGVPWVTDPSNRNSRFGRARVRHELLPLMEDISPGATEHLLSLAREARAIAIESDVESDYENVIKTVNLNNGLNVSRDVLSRLSDARRARLLRRMLLIVRGHLRSVDRAHVVAATLAMRERGRTRCFEFPGGAVALISFGELYVFPSRVLSPCADAVSVVGAHASLPAFGVAVRLEGDLPPGIVLRARGKGDRVTGSSRTFAALMSRLRVPPFYRDFFPVVALGDQVISTPWLLTRVECGLTVNWELDDSCPLNDLKTRYDQSI